MTRRVGGWTAIAAAAFAGLLVVVSMQAGSLAAGALLHPRKSVAAGGTPEGCENVRLAGAGIALAGWRCSAEGARRGTLVYLHGIADNRGSSRGLIPRYRPRGLDVVAYDSRAHGESEGESCTYGFHEKEDLRRVIRTLAPGPVLLLGTSLGAAVALQATPGDARVTGVVAAEVFSDLRTVAQERAPMFVPRPIVNRAFRVAEQRGGFEVDAVSPFEAARRIQVPVLLVHGARDRETRPAHSHRVHDALAGPKRLIVVEDAGHNQCLSGGAIWSEIDRWIEDRLAARP